MVEKREKKKRRYLGRGSGREGKHCVRKAMAAAFSQSWCSFLQKAVSRKKKKNKKKSLP